MPRGVLYATWHFVSSYFTETCARLRLQECAGEHKTSEGKLQWTIKALIDTAYQCHSYNMLLEDSW